MNFLARHIRIRSWKDVVAIIVTMIIYVGGNFLLERFAPGMSERARKILLAIVAVVICVLVLIGLDA